MPVSGREALQRSGVQFQPRGRIERVQAVLLVDRLAAAIGCF